MCGIAGINKADRDLAITKFGITKQQLLEAEKLYNRSSCSWMHCASIIKSKEKK